METKLYWDEFSQVLPNSSNKLQLFLRFIILNNFCDFFYDFKFQLEMSRS